MSNTQVIGGTHADTGRRMEVIVSMDETNSPSDLIAIIQGLDNVELSLLALAEAMAVTSIRYGQAMARIIGCPNFRSRFKSSKIEVLTFDHLVQQYPDQQTPIQFEMLHRSKLDPLTSAPTSHRENRTLDRGTPRPNATIHQGCWPTANTNFASSPHK
jgi:hypothetical protein